MPTMEGVERKQFVFYRSFLEAVDAMPEKEQLPILKAIANYALKGEEPDDLGPFGRVVWLTIKPVLDSQWSRARGGMALAGKPCPAKRGNRNAAKSPAPAAPAAPSPDSTGGDGGGTPARKRFVPPSVEEVAAYAREQGLTMDAAAFVDYFASNGWKVGGKAAMKDWRPAVRNWARRDERDRARGGRAQVARSKQPPIDLYRDDDDL